MVHMLTFGVYRWSMLPYIACIRILWDCDVYCWVARNVGDDSTKSPAPKNLCAFFEGRFSWGQKEINWGN